MGIRKCLIICIFISLSLRLSLTFYTEKISLLPLYFLLSLSCFIGSFFQSKMMLFYEMFNCLLFSFEPLIFPVPSKFYACAFIKEFSFARFCFISLLLSKMFISIKTVWNRYCSLRFIYKMIKYDIAIPIKSTYINIDDI